VVLRGVSATVSVRDDGSGEIPEDPGTVCLNCVDICGREEELADGVTGRIIVEEREEGPVDQPCSMLELRKRIIE
jgi:hypothetical protein